VGAGEERGAAGEQEDADEDAEGEEASSIVLGERVRGDPARERFVP